MLEFAYTFLAVEGFGAERCRDIGVASIGFGCGFESLGVVREVGK